MSGAIIGLYFRVTSSRARGWFLASFLLAVWPRSARATVAWSATHESGNLSEWTLGPNPTKTLPDGGVRKNVEVVGEQVYGGRYACKITVHPDDTFGQYNQDRVDIQHSSTLTAEGQDSYVSGYFYLLEDAKTRNEIFFYETKVSFRNWMDLWIEPKAGGGTTVKFGIESNGANLGSVLLWTGDWSAKQWHQFAIHVHWSTNAQNGVVDVWFDGQPVVSGHKHNTKFDTNAMFFNVGLHRVLPQNFVETIYFDDFIEADTQAEIKIGAPMGSGSDAGTGDAAPSADASDSGAGGAAGAGAAGAAGTSNSGTGGGSGGSGGGTGGGGESGTGGTGFAGASGTTTGAQAGAGGAATTGHAAPADAAGCTCVLSAASSPPKRWDAVACLFAALAFFQRRRRARR